MKKCVGQVRLHGKRLSYYVIGDRNTGYGVRITETCMEKDNLHIGEEVVVLVHRLYLFKDNKVEIIENNVKSDVVSAYI